jgi:hypothetical protein
LSCQSDISVTETFILLADADRPLLRLLSTAHTSADLCNLTHNKCSDSKAVIASGGRGSSFQHFSVMSNENRLFFRELAAVGQHHFGRSKFVGNMGEAIFASAADRVLHVTLTIFFQDKSNTYVAVNSGVVDFSDCHFSDTQDDAKRKLPSANVLRNCGYEESDERVSIEVPVSRSCWALLPKSATDRTRPIVYLALAAVVIAIGGLIYRQFCWEKKPDTAPLMYV